MRRCRSLELPKPLAGHFALCDGAFAILGQVIARTYVVVDPSAKFKGASGCKHVSVDIVPEEKRGCIVCGREAEVCDYGAPSGCLVRVPSMELEI